MLIRAILFLITFVAKSTLSTECLPNKVDLVLVLDSYSAVEDVFLQYKRIALDLAQELSYGKDETQLALVLQNISGPFVNYSFNQPQSNAAIFKTISSLTYQPIRKFSSAAVALGIKQFVNARLTSTKVMVLMTDGNINEPFINIMEQSNILHKVVDKVYVIGLGDHVQKEVLKRYAEDDDFVRKENLPAFKAELKRLTINCSDERKRDEERDVRVTKDPVLCPTVPAVRPVVISFKCPPPTPCPTPAPVKCPKPVPCTSDSIRQTKIVAPEGWCPCFGQKNFIAQQSSTSIQGGSFPISFDRNPISTKSVVGPPSISPPTSDRLTSSRPSPNPSTPGSRDNSFTSPPIGGHTFLQNTPVPAVTSPLLLSRQKCQKPGDFLFILDSSGNEEKIFQQQIDIIVDYINDLSVDSHIHQVAFVQFNSERKQKLQFSFTAFSNSEKLKNAIKALPFFPGKSSSGEAIKFAETLLLDARSTVPAVVLVFTTDVDDKTLVESSKIQQSHSNINLFAIEVADDINKSKVTLIDNNKRRFSLGSDVNQLKNFILVNILNCIDNIQQTKVNETTQSQSSQIPTVSRKNLSVNGDWLAETNTSSTATATKTTTSSEHEFPSEFFPLDTIRSIDELLIANAERFDAEFSLLVTTSQNLASSTTRPLTVSSSTATPTSNATLLNRSSDLLLSQKISTNVGGGVTVIFPLTTTNSTTRGPVSQPRIIPLEKFSSVVKSQVPQPTQNGTSNITTLTSSTTKSLTPIVGNTTLQNTSVSQGRIIHISEINLNTTVQSIRLAGMIDAFMHMSQTVNTTVSSQPSLLLTNNQTVGSFLPAGNFSSPQLSGFTLSRGADIPITSPSSSTLFPLRSSQNELTLAPIPLVALPSQKILTDSPLEESISNSDPERPIAANNHPVISDAVQANSEGERKQIIANPADAVIRPHVIESSYSRPSCLMDIMFIVDSSGSVENTYTAELKTAAEIVDRLLIGPDNAHVAMIRYAGPGKAITVFPFNKYFTTTEIKSAIISSGFISGITETDEALDAAANEYEPDKGARPNRASFICIIFTDGYSQKDTKEAALKLRNKGATIYALANDDNQAVDKDELIQITGDEAKVFYQTNLARFYRLLDDMEANCKRGNTINKSAVFHQQKSSKNQ